VAVCVCADLGKRWPDAYHHLSHFATELPQIDLDNVVTTPMPFKFRAISLHRGLVASTRSARLQPGLSWSPAQRPLVPGSRSNLERRLPIARQTSQRAFSVTNFRRFADVQEDFDPKSVERESDEVDVCIVGGGVCQDLTCSDDI
jgi:hypothetical protein